MYNDPPTVPNLHRYEYEADGSPEAGAPGAIPSWPLAGERNWRALGANRSPRGDVSTLVLGVSLGANAVLLVGLLGLLLLGHAGFFSPGGSSAGRTPGVSTPGVALSSPTATSSAVPVSGGWLRVAPSSVQLGCADSQRTQFVVLVNTGPQKVRWQADLSVPADQAGVAVSPDHGDLAAGASMPLQIQNTTQAVGQQGVIRFDPAAAAAGPPPSLNFTTVACQ